MIPGAAPFTAGRPNGGIGFFSMLTEGAMPIETCPIAAKLNELFFSEGAHMGLMWFDDLSEAQGTLAAVWELEQEFYNGGFLQYFQNSSGDRVPVICAILERVGAHAVIPIVQRAMALAGPYIPWADDEKRFYALAALDRETKSALYNLGDEFSASLDDLNLLLFHYLRQHRDAFEAPEEFWTEGGDQ